MSYSPPIRRLSTASTNSNSLSHKQSEDLINAYEAEEERIINILSRKLEKLREEKIDLENALEAESESHVNRLSRELTLLRQQQQQQPSDSSPDGLGNGNGFYVSEPNAQVMLEVMRRDNEQLRGKLVDMERDYGKIKRMNEIYREELIEHRKTLGLSIDNLIGLNSSDPYSQPTHQRSSSFSSQFSSNASSPSTSLAPLRSNGIAIPRQGHPHPHSIPTPLSHSPDSPFSYPPFSPIQTIAGSHTTQMTSPPSSSVEETPAIIIPRALSYPSVPPPSLASSFGSPSVMYHHMPLEERDGSRRNSNAGPRSNGARVSRRGSVERGGRVAETGTLVPRSRAGSQSTAQTLTITEETLGD